MRQRKRKQIKGKDTKDNQKEQDNGDVEMNKTRREGEQIKVEKEGK